MAKANTEKYEFQAEIRQLLDILAHSLYTNKEIFIRELISNAADALDKVRFKSIKGEKIADPDLDFEIRIKLDKDEKTITITDTGIGMSKQELIENIGTIAKSGSAEFIKKLKESDQEGLNLIGKFGVGFYSVFMVAKKVEIITRSAEESEPPHEWTSDGSGTFEIRQIDKAPRGTSVKIYLRDDAEEFAEKYRVESVVRKYSNFVPFPIYLEDEQINKISAIWREPKSSVTQEQYNEFYKFIANDTEDPFSVFHLSTDVPIQFHCLLFIPKTNREILGLGREEEGIQLFVRRVLIDPHAKDILPHYLRFVKGVLDSDDLPLNISRETLQENTTLFKIKNTLISKFLQHLQDIAKDESRYNEFWKQHGRILKEGFDDYTHREKLAELFRFNSSKCEKKEDLISLQTYVDRMKENQDEIYYLFGPAREAIEKNPSIEIFKAKDIEVLYLYDPIDEFVMNGLHEYKGKKFVSADLADISKLQKIKGGEDKKDEKTDKKAMDKLARRIKDILGDKVVDVRVSDRLVESPAALVSPDNVMSAQMQKMMYLLHEDASVPRRVMEINPKHPLIKNLNKIYKKSPKDPFLEKAVISLYDSIVLLDGLVRDPHAIVQDFQTVLLDSTKMYVEKT